MSESKTAQAKRDVQTQERLVCWLSLIDKVGRCGPIKGMGELKLKNLSDESVDIRYQMSPLQYAELIVTGPGGEVVSEDRFGDRFSPMREEKVLRLTPGETFTSEVPLLSTVPRDKRLPGKYKVRAIYEYDGVRAESNEVSVVV